MTRWLLGRWTCERISPVQSQPLYCGVATLGTHSPLSPSSRPIIRRLQSGLRRKQAHRATHWSRCPWFCSFSGAWMRATESEISADYGPKWLGEDFYFLFCFTYLKKYVLNNYIGKVQLLRCWCMMSLAYC